MKLENVLKKFGDEKLEIKKFTVNADKKEEKEKSANNNMLFDFKDRITKYMLMPFQVFNEVFIPKGSGDDKTGDDKTGDDKTGDDSNDNESNKIMKKCNGKKNKRKCIKKAIKKTCRRKGNMRKICKRTLKRKLLH
jgi:hypothetical protein